MPTLIFDGLVVECQNVNVSGDREEIVIHFDGEFDVSNGIKDDFLILIFNKYLEDESVEVTIPGDNPVTINERVTANFLDDGKKLSFEGEVHHRISRSQISIGYA